MATIAKTSILMSLNAGGLVTGLKGVSGQVKSFGSSIMSMGKLAAAAGVVFGGAASVGGMVAWAKSTVNQIDRLDELALKTGISTDALSRMGYAAKFSGLEVESLASSMVKMEKELTSSQTKASVFSVMGLDAKKLASMKPDEAFLTIADAIAKIPNPMDRAAASMAIFGKSGADLLPFISSGKEGIAELMDEADKLGVTIGEKDAIKVANLADQMDKMAAAGQGAMNQLVIQTAPFVTSLLESVTNWVKNSEGAVYGVTFAIETVIAAIATAADYLDLVDAGFGYLAAGADIAIGAIIGAFADLVDAIAPVLEYLGMGDFAADSAEGIRAFATALEEVAGQEYTAADEAYENFANGTRAAKVHEFFDGIRAGADKAAEATANTRHQTAGFSQDLSGLIENAGKIDDILTRLAESVTEFGISEGDKVMESLKQLGASDVQLAKAQELSAELDKLNYGKKLDDEAAKIKEDILSPAEKAQKEIAKLDELFNSGRLSWDEYGKAVAAVGNIKTPEVSAPDMFETGSQQSQRLLLDLQRGTGLDDTPFDKLTAETKTQTGVLKSIDKKIKAPESITAVKLAA